MILTHAFFVFIFLDSYGTKRYVSLVGGLVAIFLAFSQKDWVSSHPVIDEVHHFSEGWLKTNQTALALSMIQLKGSGWDPSRPPCPPGTRGVGQDVMNMGYFPMILVSFSGYSQFFQTCSGSVFRHVHMPQHPYGFLHSS